MHHFLDELLEKTVITKNFEEVVGRKIYKIYQETCSFSEREKEVYRIAVKEFDKIRRKYFFSLRQCTKGFHVFGFCSNCCSF